MRNRIKKKLCSANVLLTGLAIVAAVGCSLYLLAVISSSTKPTAMAESIDVSAPAKVAAAPQTQADEGEASGQAFDLLGALNASGADEIELDTDTYSRVLGDSEATSKIEINPAKLLMSQEQSVRIPGR